MHLRILLPYKVFLDIEAVTSIVVETPAGSFGMLPLRRDCVAPLNAGILTYVRDDGESFVAIDEGTLTKCGSEVYVSVRNAVTGSNLEDLRAAVDQEFCQLDDRERSQRSLMVKLENGFIQHFLDVERS